MPLVTLAITAAATATNLRQLRNWHQRTSNGDPDNPLLATEPAFQGFAYLTDHRRCRPPGRVLPRGGMNPHTPAWLSAAAR